MRLDGTEPSSKKDTPLTGSAVVNAGFGLSTLSWSWVWECPLLADSVEKSSRDFCPLKSVSNVEIWVAQKTEQFWFYIATPKSSDFLAAEMKHTHKPAFSTKSAAN